MKIFGNNLTQAVTSPRSGSAMPVWEPLWTMPVTSAAGSCICSDERGTDRYIYCLLDATNFWRFDKITGGAQQLASPAAFVFAKGCTMCYDPSRGGVWLFAPLSVSPWCILQYFDASSKTATMNTWVTKAVTGITLTAQWGSTANGDGCLLHTCPSYNSAAGDDDILYLAGNDSATWYSYSVTANAWTASGSATFPNHSTAIGSGCYLGWMWADPTPKILIVRSGGSAVIRYWIVGANSTPGVSTYFMETVGTGSCGCYDPIAGRVIMQRNATHRLLSIEYLQNVVNAGGVIPGTSGAAICGDGIVYGISPNWKRYAYYREQSGTTFGRLELF